MVMTSSGKITRFNVNEVGIIGRLTQGVRLMSSNPAKNHQPLQGAEA